MQGQGLGSDLLLAAGERALAVAQEVGGVALAIDAKDENAARWYARFGALHLLDDPLKLVIPLSVIAEAIGWPRWERPPAAMTESRRDAAPSRPPISCEGPESSLSPEVGDR